MVKLVGLAQVFSHRRVLGVIELMMPSYVVSVIKGVPSASDIPGSAIDLDMYLSCPHCCHGTCIMSVFVFRRVTRIFIMFSFSFFRNLRRTMGLCQAGLVHRWSYCSDWFSI